MLLAVMESQGSSWSMTSAHSWWRSQSSTCLSGSFLSGFVASSAGFSPPQVDGLSLKNTQTLSGYSIRHYRKKETILYFTIWPDLHRFGEKGLMHIFRLWREHTSFFTSNECSILCFFPGMIHGIVGFLVEVICCRFQMGVYRQLKVR